ESAGDTGHGHADPGRTSYGTEGEARDGTQHQGAFEAQVHSAGLFRNALPQADEQEGSADADCPAENGHGQRPQPEVSSRLAHLAAASRTSRGAKTRKRP